MDREILRRSLPPPAKDGIEDILVDEKYLGPARAFVTLVMNGEAGEPLHLSPGKDQAPLERFFNSCSIQQKSSIRFIGIDRGNTYKACAEKKLPGIKVCYDPFRLVANRTPPPFSPSPSSPAGREPPPSAPLPACKAWGMTTRGG